MNETNYIGLNLNKYTNNIDVDDKIDDCSICYTSFESDNLYVSTPCGHNFHKKCILKWLQIKSNCPCCRTDILKISSSLLVNRMFKNIQVMEETPHYFYVKILDRDYGIPIQFTTIDKSDIDLIISQTNGMSISTLQIIYTFVKNELDIVDTIMELIPK